MRTRAICLIAMLVVSVSVAFAGKKKPLKVYILSGQSNMVGMASATTFAHIKMFPDSAKEFQAMFNEDGSPVVLDDVWIWSNVTPRKDQTEVHGKLGPTYGARGTCIGPEYTFGVYMHKALQEPFLIIKTAWGGKSLYFDFRSPSAGQWTPPPGHPDLVKKKPTILPIPKKLDLPADYVPPESIVPKYAGRVGKFMGLTPMRGVGIGKVSGVYPIYLTSSPRQKFKGNPFAKGDIIIGVDGVGLRENPVEHWREAFHGSRNNDWMVTVTRWRKGRIETFDFDISQILDGGRADIEKVMAEAKRKNKEYEKNKGLYYRKMMDHVRTVLGDIKRVYPDYDAKAGYEIAGFVWFQGWNDLVASGTYPNRDKPRGYEQYSWLLKHFINDVRKDLGVPNMPFVIGTMGVGGVEDPPTSNKGHLQQAMVAPAGYPEFKGNVAVVRTGKYWDKRLEDIDNRSWKIGQYRKVLQKRDGLEGEALNKAYAQYRAKYITPQEEEILKKGRSNKGYHYLGSGKTMAGIGKAFAEAMAKLHAKAK